MKLRCRKWRTCPKRKGCQWAESFHGNGVSCSSDWWCVKIQAYTCSIPFPKAKKSCPKQKEDAISEPLPLCCTVDLKALAKAFLKRFGTTHCNSSGIKVPDWLSQEQYDFIRNWKGGIK